MSDAGVTRLSPLLPRAGEDAGAGAAAARARRGHRSRGRRVRPRAGVHRAGARAAARALSGPQGRARAHHDARGGAVRGSQPAPTSRRRSPRTTCCSTATRCSRAACGRTTTACRCSSARTHREALVAAATSGNPKFFLGTDSAPHARGAKEAACGCAGIYTAHAALELYAEAFDAAGALDRLEAFASRFGAAFLRPAAQRGHGHARRERLDACPQTLPFGDATLVPLRAGETLPWKIA